MEKKRLDYLDMTKGVGIFFVCLGHIEYISAPLRTWISSFHMPLFFIVTGLLMAIKDEPSRDFKTAVLKKFKGIIIPYLWFSLSYFIIDIFNVLVLKNIDIHTFIVDTISSATFYGMSVLWFLPAIFLADIGFLWLKKHVPDRILVFALLVIAIVSYLIHRMFLPIYDAHADSLFITSLINFGRVFTRATVCMSFVGYGYYIHKAVVHFLPSFSGDLPAKHKIISFICGVCMLAVNIWLSMLNDCVDLHNIILNNVALYFIGAFLGCFGIILILRAIPSCKIVTYYGRNSMIVMAAHVNYYILYAGLRIGMKVIQYTTHAKQYILVGVTMIVVFLLCTIVIEGINRLFPFVLGKPFSLPWKSKN